MGASRMIPNNEAARVALVTDSNPNNNDSQQPNGTISNQSTFSLPAKTTTSTATAASQEQRQQPPSNSTLSSALFSSSFKNLGCLLICAAGICISYVYYGILQEQLFTNKAERLGASFVLVTSCITNTLVALLWNCLQTQRTVASSRTTTTSPRKERLPHGLLIVTAGCYVGAMACSNEAVPYVSYPVAVLAKSCKLIPIMLVGSLTSSSSLYSRTEWMAAIFISVGIVTFQFSRLFEQQEEKGATTTHNSSNQQQQERLDQLYGLALLLFSLLLDGLLSSCQTMLKNKAKSTTNATTRSYRTPNAVETMFYVNLYSLLYLLPWTWSNGQLQEGWYQCIGGGESQQEQEQQQKHWYKLAMINGTVAIGQIFIFLTVTWYSPMVTTTITTTRKFVTILVSVRTFGHVFTVVQWMAIATVFAGLYLAILAQQQKQQPSQHQQQTQTQQQQQPNQTPSKRNQSQQEPTREQGQDGRLKKE